MTHDPIFDFVIIGAGTAGCLLANRLSADPARRVLLVEAGGDDNYHWIHIPVGYLRCIGNPRTDWRYRTEQEAGLNGRDLLYPRGKVLGGSSSINGMIYMRGQARDYDGWGAGDGFGANPGWSWDECLPHFMKHEDFHKGADAFHGASGFDPSGVRPGGSARSIKASMVGMKSSATVQQRQPLDSSTIFSSGQLVRPQLRKVSPSTPTLPNSLTMMARRFPLAFSSTWRSSVVLPAPRKPVMMVAGMRAVVIRRRP